MAPELLLIVEALLCLHQFTRRGNLIILTRLPHVFICTYRFGQHTQMKMQWHNDDALLKGNNGGGTKKIYLIASKLEDNQGQFIQWPKVQKPIFEKPNRVTAPVYCLQLHQQRPRYTNIHCSDSLSGFSSSFGLRYNHVTPFSLSIPLNITKMS